MADLVLSPREFRLLEGLRFMPRKNFAGRVRGERLTAKKGISIEFSDFRNYAEGDDLRHLDWNVLARLDTPIVRTYQDEEDLAVHILLDVSPSMEFGEPSKLSWGRRVACAFGHIGLGGGDAVHLRLLGGGEPGAVMRGRTSYVRFARGVMGGIQVGNRGVSGAIRQFLSSTARVGLVVVISDGMDPDFPGLIKSLAGRGHEVLMIQVLSPVELDPDLEGDLRLIDSEGAGEKEITANRLTFEAYKKNLLAHNQAIRDACTSMGGRYRLMEPGDGLEVLVRDVLQREGWVA